MVRSPDFCTIGGAVLLLKRLPDAQADGDRDPGGAARHGRQSGRPHDEHPTPSQSAQAAAFRVALAAGVLRPPSTPIGDPIEYASLAEVYGTARPCALASVKTNFGHSAINYFFRVNWLTSM
jgi:polyketide synthase 2